MSKKVAAAGYRPRLLSLVGMIIFILAIVHFSNQPASEQDLSPEIKKCKWLVQAVRDLPRIHINYEGHIEDSHKNPVGFIEFGIRKTVHFTIYGTFGLLALANLSGMGWKGRRLYGGGLLAVLMLSGWDEWNQVSVLGRSGLYYDVILDTCGFICFALVRSYLLKRDKAAH